MYCGYIMLYNEIDIYIYICIHIYAYQCLCISHIINIICIYIYGGCSKFFYPKAALGPALGQPCAELSCATTVPCEFLVAHVFVPHFRARFRALFRVASYSYSAYTNVCLLVRASFYQKIYLPLFTNYIHILYPCACLCF